MRGIHPQSASRALAWFVAMVGLVGCQGSKQSAAFNPFLSPDRVPPPATRAVAPGTAQPYYPGDPLPAMQSMDEAPNQQVILASGTIGQAATPSVVEPSTTDATLAFTDERRVSIPADNGDLRFESAPLNSEPEHFLAPPDSAPIAAVPFDAGRPENIVMASGQQPPVAEARSVTASFIPPQSPWREPQLPQFSPQAAPPTLHQPGVAQASMVATGPSPWNGTSSMLPAQGGSIEASSTTMDVRLREVSPPPQPPDTTTPRIRIPSPVTTTQTFLMPDGSIHEVTYTPISMTSDAPQSVAITSLADSSYGTGAVPLAVGAGGSGQLTPASASRDGFRPRGSTR